MKEKIKFYRCPICGNVIEIIEGTANSIVCCGKKIEELNANTVDASKEKHIPIYEKIDSEIRVKVGETKHPMEDTHYIMWIAQVTNNSITRVELKPNEEPEIRLPYIKGAVLYAYCNIHGLWKKIVD